MDIRPLPMKIVKRLRDIYNECKPRYTLLSEEVRKVLKPKVEERDWFFLSRLKELESFALKVETGRVPYPAKLEDLYACTIVVPTMAETTDAERLCLRYSICRNADQKTTVLHIKPHPASYLMISACTLPAANQ